MASSTIQNNSQSTLSVDPIMDDNTTATTDAKIIDTIKADPAAYRCFSKLANKNGLKVDEVIADFAELVESSVIYSQCGYSQPSLVPSKGSEQNIDGHCQKKVAQFAETPREQANPHFQRIQTKYHLSEEQSTAVVDELSSKPNCKTGGGGIRKVIFKLVYKLVWGFFRDSLMESLNTLW